MIADSGFRIVGDSVGNVVPCLPRFSGCKGQIQSLRTEIPLGLCFPADYGRMWKVKYDIANDTAFRDGVDLLHMKQPVRLVLDTQLRTIPRPYGYSGSSIRLGRSPGVIPFSIIHLGQCFELEIIKGKGHLGLPHLQPKVVFLSPQGHPCLLNLVARLPRLRRSLLQPLGAYHRITIGRHFQECLHPIGPLFIPASALQRLARHIIIQGIGDLLLHGYQGGPLGLEIGYNVILVISLQGHTASDCVQQVMNHLFR